MLNNKLARKIYQLAGSVLILLSITLVSNAQEPPVPSIINAENIAQLQPIQQLDFSQLPPDIETASGQFVMSADASRLVSFGNQLGDPPFSQAIIWEDDEIIGIIALDGDSVVRELTADGQCLYVGYQGHLKAYRLDSTQEINEFLYVELPHSDDFAVNFWQDDTFSCSSDFYVEVASSDGQLYRGEVINDIGFVLMDTLFTLSDIDTAARVGRIPPPLALTIDFDGNLYRWDMLTNQVTAQIDVGEIAMFGKLNAAGDYYVWLSSTQDGLYLAGFANEAITQIAELDKVYISHLILNHPADVVLGVDPYDTRGTVSAWDITSGERLDLGAYRICERIQPDLVQLSADGTTLVIGCDLGLDIWQIVASSE